DMLYSPGQLPKRKSALEGMIIDMRSNRTTLINTGSVAQYGGRSKSHTLQKIIENRVVKY
ncbi:MAG: hypothetical protein ACREIC_12795, partial [Limisphaerales bacterium]